MTTGTGTEAHHTDQPRTGLEKTVADIWAAVLGFPVGMDDNFFDAGGDSLLAARLLARVESELGVRLPRRRAADLATVRRMARRIAAAVPADAPDRSLVRFSPDSARPVLFLVHGMGGHVLVFGRLARALDDFVQVVGFESVGRNDEARGDRSVEAMAARYLADMRRVQPCGPYRLGGYSMGGAVALRMAADLAAQGETVDHLLLLDCDLRPPDTAALRARTVEFVARALGLDPPVTAPYDGVDAAAEEICARLGGPDAGITPAEIRRFCAIYLANAEAMAAFTPPPYTGPMTLVYTAEGTSPGSHTPVDPAAYGWDRYRDAGRFHAAGVPGDHWTLFTTHVRELAGVCRAVLGPNLPRSSG